MFRILRIMHGCIWTCRDTATHACRYGREERVGTSICFVMKLWRRLAGLDSSSGGIRWLTIRRRGVGEEWAELTRIEFIHIERLFCCSDGCVAVVVAVCPVVVFVRTRCCCVIVE